MNTPSKLLFSPNLRNDETAKIEPLRRPTLPSSSSDGTGDDNDEFNPYLFMSTLPPHREAATPNKIVLPPKHIDYITRPTLVLDLDETLVHCTVEPITDYDLQFSVMFNNTFYQVYVRKRPYLDEFLTAVSQHFEVVIFTASQKIYADNLLNLLDPENKKIHHRFVY